MTVTVLPPLKKDTVTLAQAAEAVTTERPMESGIILGYDKDNILGIAPFGELSWPDVYFLLGQASLVVLDQTEE